MSKQFCWFKMIEVGISSIRNLEKEVGYLEAIAIATLLCADYQKDKCVDEKYLTRLLNIRFPKAKKILHFCMGIISDYKRITQQSERITQQSERITQQSERITTGLLNNTTVTDASNPVGTETPSIERIERIDKYKEREKKNTKKKIDETRFCDFWDAYDYKIARGKAEDSYLKAIQSGVDEAVLIRQAKAYVASLNDRKYQKHPATWLNAKCWEDEYRQSKQQQPVQPTQEKDYGSIDDL